APSPALFPSTTLFRSDPLLMVMPVFRSGATGLVSTVDDLVRFATMLLDRGDAPRGRVLAESTWRALVTSDLTPAAARDAETFIRSEEHTSELQSRENL